VNLSNVLGLLLVNEFSPLLQGRFHSGPKELMHLAERPFARQVAAQLQVIEVDVEIRETSLAIQARGMSRRRAPHSHRRHRNGRPRTRPAELLACFLSHPPSAPTAGNEVLAPLVKRKRVKGMLDMRAEVCIQEAIVLLEQSELSRSSGMPTDPTVSQTPMH